MLFLLVPLLMQTITTNLRGGYQIVAADLTGDGKKDLIALASGMDRVVWYENPGWRERVLVEDVAAPINLDVWDGRIVMAEKFSPDPRKSAGMVSVLEPAGDPRRPWRKRQIDLLPTSHRLRWADLDGTGRKVLVNAPLAGAAAVPPEYDAAVPLVFYRPGEWKREVISEDLRGVLHGIFVVDWDGDGADEILTASFEGIHLFDRSGSWRKARLAGPKEGSSDVAVGRANGRRFLCAIEPWHGHMLAVYTEERGAWQRTIVDNSFVDGHALLAADLDGDGADEIVAGYRGKGRSVYVYKADGPRWVRTPLDEGGMGAASCAVADLDGDGRPEIACIDSTSVKIYKPPADAARAKD
jgi:hypothetical protein